MKQPQKAQELTHWIHWFEPMYRLQALVRSPNELKKRKLSDLSGESWFAVVTFRLSPKWDRLAIDKVEITALGEHRIDGELWRSFPIAQVESIANVPAYFRILKDHRDSIPPSEDPRLPAELREAAKTKPLPMGNFTKLPEGVRVKYPDSHYQRVADVYSFHVAHGHPPAKRMSEDWGVPVTTIHGWTKEARRRGLLAPARTAGRAG